MSEKVKKFLVKFSPKNVGIGKIYEKSGSKIVPHEEILIGKMLA